MGIISDIRGRLRILRDLILWRRDGETVFYLILLELIFFFAFIQNIYPIYIISAIIVYFFLSDVAPEPREKTHGQNLPKEISLLFSFLTILRENTIIIIGSLATLLSVIIFLNSTYYSLLTFSFLSFNIFTFVCYKYTQEELAYYQYKTAELIQEESEYFKTFNIHNDTLSMVHASLQASYMHELSYYELADYRESIARCLFFFDKIKSIIEDNKIENETKKQLKSVWQSQQSHRDNVTVIKRKKKQDTQISELERELREVFLISELKSAVESVYRARDAAEMSELQKKLSKEEERVTMPEDDSWKDVICVDQKHSQKKKQQQQQQQQEAQAAKEEKHEPAKVTLVEKSEKQKRIEEKKRLKKQQELENKRREEQERRRIEDEEKRRKKKEELERKKKEEEEMKKKKEEEERIRAEEQKRKEEEERIHKEEEEKRKAELMRKEEEKRKQWKEQEEKKRQNELMQKQKEEQQRKLIEERKKKEEQERLERERIQREEKERLERERIKREEQERLERERIQREEQERLASEEQERIRREEKEKDAEIIAYQERIKKLENEIKELRSKGNTSGIEAQQQSPIPQQPQQLPNQWSFAMTPSSSTNQYPPQQPQPYPYQPMYYQPSNQYFYQGQDTHFSQPIQSFPPGFGGYTQAPPPSSIPIQNEEMNWEQTKEKLSQPRRSHKGKKK